MKIEHWRSRVVHQEEQLDYRNLLGACPGGEGQPHHLQHCDTRKGDRDLLWNPADPERRVEDRISYSNDGTIQSDDPMFDQELNDVLNLNLLIVVLVGVSTWAQSKTTVMVATDERARTQQQMMQWMLPIMFMFFGLSFPSGVSLYWVVTSIVSVGFNVVTYGFPALNIPSLVGPPTPSAPATAPATATASSEGGGQSRSRPSRELRTSAHGSRRSKRKNRRRRA